MITARVIGGLGNQMFQYAAALALARQHGTEVVIDTEDCRGHAARPFQLDRLQVRAALVPTTARARRPSQPRAPRIAGKILRRIRLNGAGLTTIYREPSFHFDPGFFDQTPPVTLLGYFQSERYFTSVANEVREQFTPLRPLAPPALAVAEMMERAPVAISVHIRRGDYVSVPEVARVHGTLGVDYYRRALQVMEARLGPEITVFVFSDEPEAAGRMLNFLPRERVVLVNGDPDRPWDDLTLMSRCDHHIVANSSFSWWGAWLNPRPDKMVVAPRAWFAPHELRRKNTRDLYPATWILA